MIQSAIKMERRTITPEMAADLLARNTSNRPMGRAHVFKLAESMKRGEWNLNGSAIRISVGGRLLDGQHRLSACVESGTAFDTIVISGLEEECFSTIDQHVKPRKISDVLSIESGANMKNASAALTVLYQLREYQQIPAYTARSVAGFTSSVARQLLHKHPGIVESVSTMMNSGPLFRNSFGSCLHYVFGLVDTDLANAFATTLREGHGDGNKRRPFNVFREGLIRISHSSARANGREAAARAIKAFNAELSGKTIGVLVWRRTEDFPVIAGLDYGSL